MTRTKYLYILLTLLLATTSCSNETTMELPASSDGGTLTLTFNTRAITPGNGNSADGGGMNDLMILLVDKGSGKIARKVTESGLSSVTLKTITFENLVLGAYNIYAFANINNMLTATGLTALETGDSFTAAHFDKTFADLTGSATPENIIADNAMLLTAVKDIEIKLGINTTQIEMLRPVVKFVVELHNHSKHKMRVDQNSIKFSDFNATHSYVLPHSDFNTGAYRPLPTKSGNIEVESNSSGIIYETSLYENKAPGYTFGMNLEMFNEDGEDIYQGTTISTKSGSTTYYICNNNGTPAITTTYSPSTCLWSIQKSGNYYRIMNESYNNAKYLSVSRSNSSYSVSLLENSYRTNNRNYGSIELTLGNNFNIDADTQTSTIYCSKYNSSNTIRRYIYRNNQTLSASSSSTTWTFTKVYDTGGPSWATIASVSDKTLVKVDANTGNPAPLTEMQRNSIVKLTINAYFNDNTGTLNYNVTDWNKISNDIIFQ